MRVVLGLFLWCLVTTAQAGLKPYQQVFIQRMAATVHQVNHGIRLRRTRILNLKQKIKLTVDDVQWLHGIAKRYGVAFRSRKPRGRQWRRLLMRVNTIPASMVVAQAINESNWGRSTFARKGQNYFGMWCYRKGCGLVPANRPKGRRYEVRVFDSMKASVVSYMDNLNTNPAYASIRRARWEAAQQGHQITGYQLASGLDRYSQRRMAYVHSIQHIIQRFHLHRVDYPGLKHAGAGRFACYAC